MLSIVIPAHNEEEVIRKTIEEIYLKMPGHITFEVLVVLDHCSDGTQQIVESLMAQHDSLRYVVNPDEGCFGNALRCGFREAHGELIVPVMADLCDQIETIPTMYYLMQQGYDVVCGSRYLRGGEKHGGPFMQTFFSRAVGRTLYWFTRLPTHDASNSFKLYKRQVIEIVKPREKHFSMSMEMVLKAYMRGFKIAEVPTVWRDREAGSSKFDPTRVGLPYLALYLRFIFGLM